jgi:hypothetical protein
MDGDFTAILLKAIAAYLNILCKHSTENTVKSRKTLELPVGLLRFNYFLSKTINYK